MGKIILPKEIFNKYNDTELNEKLEKFKEEEQKKSNRGYLCINNVYVSYDNILVLDDIKYYINSNNANGTHKFKFGDMVKSMSKMEDLTFSNFSGLLNRCLFSYKIVKYNDINFIYVFNKKYEHLFDKYDDLK